MGKRRPAGADIARAARPMEAAMRTIAPLTGSHGTGCRPQAVFVWGGWPGTVGGSTRLGPYPGPPGGRASASAATGPASLDVPPEGLRLDVGSHVRPIRPAPPGWAYPVGSDAAGCEITGSWST